jgi:hypothetical protein
MSQPWTPPPPPGMGAAPPNNNLAIAIVAMVTSVVFCCLPHGLISLLFATQVNQRAAAGDMTGALNAARQAKVWGLISIALAVIWFVIAIVLGVLNAVLTSVM